MHEGNGYEAQYMSSRRITHYQGVYRGMRPFSYNGAVYPDDDVLDIRRALKCVVDILICNKTLEKIKDNIDFKKGDNT